MTALPLILSIHANRERSVDGLDVVIARLGGFLDSETATCEALGDALSLPSIGQSVCAHSGVFAPQDVDAAIRFMGARVDDQIAALPCAFEME